MTPREAILLSVELAERTTCGPLTVSGMADAAAYSIHHFCRVFARHTRQTPYDYLIRRRLTLAAGQVLNTDRRILDIAMDFRFDSHEGFTRAFTRLFAITPVRARKNGSVRITGSLPRLTADHLSCLDRQEGLVPELCHRVPPAEPVSCVPGVPEDRAATGPDRAEKETFRHGQACQGAPREVLWEEALTAGWVPPVAGPGIPVPAGGPWTHAARKEPTGSYARFRVTGDGHELVLALDWILHSWLFHSPYDLRPPGLRIDRAATTHVLVPIRPRERRRPRRGNQWTGPGPCRPPDGSSPSVRGGPSTDGERPARAGNGSMAGRSGPVIARGGAATGPDRPPDQVWSGSPSCTSNSSFLDPGSFSLAFLRSSLASEQSSGCSAASPRAPCSTHRRMD